MSKYTTEVRFICETAAGLDSSAGYSSVNDVIKKAIPKIFDFDFPIYDEQYRNVLCTKILKHYYTREIGAETVGLWKLWLDTRLNEIMPYYNQLYNSALIEFDPMHDIDLTTTHHKDGTGKTESTTDGENHSTGEGNGVNRDLFSDTPQGALDNVDNETYLTNARKNTNNYDYKADVTSTNIGTTDVSTTEDYLTKITGKTSGSSYSKRLMEYRDTFVNIDTMIIRDLGDLFMNLW